MRVICAPIQLFDSAFKLQLKKKYYNLQLTDKLSCFDFLVFSPENLNSTCVVCFVDQWLCVAVGTKEMLCGNCKGDGFFGGFSQHLRSIEVCIVSLFMLVHIFSIMSSTMAVTFRHTGIIFKFLTVKSWQSFI